MFELLDGCLKLCLFFHSFTGDSYDWGSQTSGFAAYIGDEDSQLAPPPEELNPY